MAACRILTEEKLGNRTALDTGADDPEHVWDLLNRMVAYFPDGDPGDEASLQYMRAIIPLGP